MGPTLGPKSKTLVGEVCFLSLGTCLETVTAALPPRCLLTSSGPQAQRHEQVKPGHFQEEDAQPHH